jgi:hypothetical protein
VDAIEQHVGAQLALGRQRQRMQDAGLQAGQARAAVRPMHDPLAQVQSPPLCMLTLQAPAQAGDDRAQLDQIGRLGEVDVGTAGVAFHALCRGRARGQHHDAHHRPAGTQAARDGQAVLARQVEVEDHQVRRRLDEASVELGAVAAGAHGVAQPFEVHTRFFAQGLVVLHQHHIERRHQHGIVTSRIAARRRWSRSQNCATLIEGICFIGPAHCG